MKIRAADMQTRATGRSGFVLPAVVFALVILSILAIAAHQTAGDEQRSSRAFRESGGALHAAEAGANWLWSTWDDSVAANLAPGDSTDFGWQTLPNGASYRGVLHRYDSGGTGMYMLTVVGRGAGPSGGERVVNLSLAAGGLNVYEYSRSAIATQGNLEAVSDATSTIDGNDTNVPGWSCDPPGPAMPGVLVQDMAGFSQGPGTILGNPPVAVDPTINASTFTQFGSTSYADLVAMATNLYPGGSEPSGFGPVVAGGECVTAVRSNWGDPLNPGSPCSDHFPIIHFAGEVEFTTSGSAGQGILLVDGPMHVGGGDFTFYGLIIVQGDCVFEYDSTVYGGVLCGNSANLDQEVGDAAPINFSTCALTHALEGAGVGGSSSLRPLSSRAWSELLR